MDEAQDPSAAGPDPFRLLRPWTTGDLDQWLAQTTWWARPDAAPTRSQMAVELIAAVAGRFTGRRVSIEVGGRVIELDLDEVRAETDAPATTDLMTFWSDLPGARGMRRLTQALTGIAMGEDAPDVVDRVLVEASNVTVGGHHVGSVTAVIRDVSVSYGASTELVTGTIDLQLRSTRADVVDWLDRELEGWHLASAPGGRVVAKPPGRRTAALLLPEGLDGSDVVLHVVGLRLFGRDVRLPRRWVRRIVRPLPPLPNDLELDTAHLGDPEVRVSLRHPGLRLPIRPEHVRNAVREGVSRLRLG